jgi:hypothetical protein
LKKAKDPNCHVILGDYSFDRRDINFVPVLLWFTNLLPFRDLLNIE